MTAIYLANGSSIVKTSKLPRTGQSAIYFAGDDGFHRSGGIWPTPRYAVQSNENCILDNLTGLIWAKDANLNGRGTWSDQIGFCETLDYGGRTDWRMPNKKEFDTLTDYGYFVPDFVDDSPFINRKIRYYFDAIYEDTYIDYYWTSTTDPNVTTSAFRVQLWDSFSDTLAKTGMCFVWPVCDGI